MIIGTTSPLSVDIRPKPKAKITESTQKTIPNITQLRVDINLIFELCSSGYIENYGTYKSQRRNTIRPRIRI
jgi:hypothetical protein